MADRPDFTALFDHVREFQYRVNGELWPRDPDSETASLAIRLADEAFEILRETNYKSHKPLHPLDRAAIQKEIVDSMIYSIALANIWFEDADALLTGLIEKIQVNHDRLTAETGRITLSTTLTTIIPEATLREGGDPCPFRPASS